MLDRRHFIRGTAATLAAFGSSGGGMPLVQAQPMAVGATQTFALIANPAGYHHNVVQQLTLEVM